MAIDFNLILADLIELVGSWNHKGDKDNHEELKQIEMFFEIYKKEGLTRKQSFNLIAEVLKSELSDFQEVVLWDYETSITGDIDENCIQNFPNESFRTKNELVSYVRSKEWLK
jgi:hypothetical protein